MIEEAQHCVKLRSAAPFWPMRRFVSFNALLGGRHELRSSRTTLLERRERTASTLHDALKKLRGQGDLDPWRCPSA